MPFRSKETHLGVKQGITQTERFDFYRNAITRIQGHREVVDIFRGDNPVYGRTQGHIGGLARLVIGLCLLNFCQGPDADELKIGKAGLGPDANTVGTHATIGCGPQHGLTAFGVYGRYRDQLNTRVMKNDIYRVGKIVPMKRHFRLGTTGYTPGCNRGKRRTHGLGKGCHRQQRQDDTHLFENCDFMHSLFQPDRRYGLPSKAGS